MQKVKSNVTLARFGLMHMVATNLCVWLNVIIQETKHEILFFDHDFSTKYHTRDNSLTQHPALGNSPLWCITILFFILFLLFRLLSFFFFFVFFLLYEPASPIRHISMCNMSKSSLLRNFVYSCWKLIHS